MIQFTNDIYFNEIRKKQLRETIELTDGDLNVLKLISKIELDKSISFDTFNLMSNSEFNIIFYFKVKLNKALSEADLVKVFRLCNKIVSKNKGYKILVEIESESLLLLEHGEGVVISKPLSADAKAELSFNKVNATYFEEVYLYYVQTILKDYYGYKGSKDSVLEHHCLQIELSTLVIEKNSIMSQLKKSQDVHEEEKLQKKNIDLHKRIKNLREILS